MLHIDILITTLTKVCLRCIGLWQFERHVIALLRSDELIDALYLWRVDKGTLYADRLSTSEIEHIALSNELLGTRAVENSL